MNENTLSKYIDRWMNEAGFERILKQNSTDVLDVCHINNPNGNHQTAIICSKGLVLLFPPIDQSGTGTCTLV